MYKLILVIVTLTLSACSSKPAPEQHLYFLNAEFAAQPAAQDFRYGISSVSIAPYLRRSEIMLQVADYELRPARYHRWAEPLTEGVKRVVGASLSSRMMATVDIDPQYRASWTHDISISVQRLHGELDGTVYLDATYAITSENEQKRKRFSATTTQSGSGYENLVDAQQALLADLANDVASTLREQASSGSE